MCEKTQSEMLDIDVLRSNIARLSAIDRGCHLQRQKRDAAYTHTHTYKVGFRET